MKGIRSLFAIASVFGLVCVADVRAQHLTLAFGFPRSSDVLNISDGDSMFAQAVRGGVTRALTKSTTVAGAVRLDVADSLSVSADLVTHSFRIRSGINFANGEAVRAADVVFSLQRCIESGKLSVVHAVASRSERGPLGGDLREWVDLNVVSGGQPRIMTELARCPIVEKRSASIFGKDFGFGSNLISCGDFKIADFKPSGEYSLARRQGMVTSQKVADQITLREFETDSAALTALRVGTIDGYFTSGAAIKSLLGDDETIQLASCSGYSVLYRRGLAMSCDDSFLLGRVTYVQ